jgi:acetolactate synthase small subunit
MRWCFVLQCEDQVRMQSRVLQIVDSQLLAVNFYSVTRLEGKLFMNFVVEADERQAYRIESLLYKIHGMGSIERQADTGAMPRVVALLRVRCDISKRNELLHFIGAFSARVLMIRPLWLCFEIAGTPAEVEDIYQSCLGYGTVDQVASSCIFLASE